MPISPKERSWKPWPAGTDRRCCALRTTCCLEMTLAKSPLGPCRWSRCLFTPTLSSVTPGHRLRGPIQTGFKKYVVNIYKQKKYTIRLTHSTFSAWKGTSPSAIVRISESIMKCSNENAMLTTHRNINIFVCKSLHQSLACAKPYETFHVFN